MFGLIKKYKANKQEQPGKSSGNECNAEDSVPSCILQCEKLVKNIFGASSEITVESYDAQKERAMIVYVDGLINKDLMDRDIISPLKSNDFGGNIDIAIKTHYKVVDNIPDFVDEVLQGKTALFYEGSKKIFIIDIKQWDKRSVEAPDAEAVIHGPKEGFTESIRTNTALLRRRIRSSKLVIENIIIGRQGNTPVCIAYVEGIVNQNVLK